MATNVHPVVPATTRFEILGVLGVGGMGVVYEAFDRERNRVVALKTLRSLTLDSLRRFKNEFRSLQDLEHPNLVGLDELIEVDGTWFFTMEKVDGVDFLTWVRPPDLAAAAAELEIATATGVGATPPPAVDRTYDTDDPAARPVTARMAPGGLDEGRLRDALIQLARGLATLHAAGKVHRDVKPANAMVTRDGRVVLLDFGLVSHTGERGERFVGTVPYMAPEQAGTEEVGAAADCYAVGVTLFRALTGRFPFSGDAEEVMALKRECEAPAPSSLEPGLPADLERLCADLLRRRPEQRPAAREILARLGVAGTGSAPASTTTFVGRGAELAELHDRFAAAATTGGVVLIHGESGVGKSALVRRFLADLAERGHPTPLASRCYERETVPYKAVDQLIDALARRLSALEPEVAAGLLPADISLLAAIFPVLAQAPAVLTAMRAVTTLSTHDPFAQRAAGFRALRQLVTRLAAHERVVLAIDDLQWADQDSLALLAELMAAPAPAVLLCATVRATAAGVLATLTDRLGEVRVLEVEPLPPDDARELVQRLAASVPGGERVHADELAGEAGGHPMLIDALVRYRLDHPDSSRSMRLDDAILARSADLDPATRRVLDVVCVAGGPVQQEACAHAIGIPFGDLADRISTLRAAHLVRTDGVRRADDVEPFHDRVREAVVAQLDADDHRDLHGRLGRALEARGGDPEALAVHFQAAGDPKRAVRYAARAADRAFEALAFDRAIRLYRLALDLDPGTTGVASRLRVRLAESLDYAGRCVEAAEVYVAAARLAPEDELELRRRATAQYMRAGRITEGIETLEDVLATIGVTVPKTHGKAVRRFLWELVRLRIRGLKFEPRAEADAPPDLILKTQILFAMMPFGMTDTLRGHAIQMRHLRHALDAGVPARIARALVTQIVFEASSGGERNSAKVDQMMALAERLADEAGEPYLRGFVAATAGTINTVLGRFREGGERCDAAEKILRQHCVGVTWELATTTVLGLRARYFMGQIVEIRRRLPPALKEATTRGDLYTSSHLRVGMPIAMLCLADRDPDRARRLAAEALRDWSYPGLHLQHVHELLGLSLVDVYEGDPVAARLRLERDLPRIAGSFFRRLEQVRVLLLHQQGRVELLAAETATGAARAGHLVAARTHLRALTTMKLRWSAGLAGSLAAGIDHAAGNPEAAVAHLASAEETLLAGDMDLFAMSVRRQRGRVLGGTEGEALVASADRWMSAQTIADPARFADMFVPGFGRS